MIKKQVIFYFFLILGLCFFYGCSEDEKSQPLPQVEEPPQKMLETKVSRVSLQPKIDPEKAKKIEELINKLQGTDQRAAYDAVLKLSLMGDETAVDPLTDIYYRESGMMRQAALKALGSIGDKRSLDILMDALYDENVDMRRNAAHGLGNVGDESAIEPLIEALNDPDGWVKMNAMGSLEKITGQKFTTYDAWYDWYQGR